MSGARTYLFITLWCTCIVCVAFFRNLFRLHTILRNEATDDVMHNIAGRASCSYGGAKNRILKNPCLSLTSYLSPCITLPRQWHPFSFATATEDECARVPRMVAGASCEFIAAESSTYERWLRFESSEKKRLPAPVNDQFSPFTNSCRQKFLCFGICRFFFRFFIRS